MFKLSKIIRSTTFAILILFLHNAHAQISVQSPNGWTPLQLLQNSLVLPPAESGVYLSNGSFCNSTAALPTTTTSRIGRFQNGNTYTDFPFNNGIIMTTGAITVAPGPNNSASSGVGLAGGIADAGLAAIAAPNDLGTNGASVLEFDFVSISGLVSFEYVFASEEYPEFVCSQFNDVFAFFLTGINPVTISYTTWNIALIPGTTLPVTINNLNTGTVGSSGNIINCTPPSGSLAYSSFYCGVPTGSTGMQFDGFTIIPATSPHAVNGQRSGLFAKALIQPCTDYHMKLAIANVLDNGYDSGVFLKEGSFRAPLIEIDHNYSMNSTDTLIKGCNRDTVTFSLSQRDPTRAYTYTINPIAVPGVVLNQDYEIFYFHPTTHAFTQLIYLPGISEPVTTRIPEDSLSTYIVVKVSDNAVFAPGEIKTLTLVLGLLTCDDATIKDTLIYFLKDNHPIILSDAVINGCEVVNQITVDETGGGDVQHVTWAPTTNINTPDNLTTNCTITDTIVYTVIATDDINCRRDTATIRVNVTNPPEPSFTVDKTDGCVPLTVRFTSTTEPDFASFMFIITDEFGLVNDTIYDQTFPYTFNTPGHYSVSYYAKTADVGNCERWIHNNNYIFVSDFPVADFSWTPEEPTNGRPINFTNLATGNNITEYYWNFGNGASTTLENPTHSYHITADETYTVLFKVTNSYGCEHDTTKLIAVVDNYAFYVPNSFTPNNDGVNDLFQPRVADVLKYHLAVYNRYGECIFQSVDPDESWDGTHNEQKCPSGTYNWVITYLKYAAPETELRKTGTVSLIR